MLRFAFVYDTFLQPHFWPAAAKDSHTAQGVWEMPVSLRLLNPIMLHFRSSDQLT